MKLDNPRAFDPLANDRVRMTGLKAVPCHVLDQGDMAQGGARGFMQNGEHIYIRVEKALMQKPLVVGDTMNLEKQGSGLVKEVNEEGDFWAYTVTKHARRSK